MVNQHNKSSKRDGLWEGYYDNGKLQYKGFYKDGIRLSGITFNYTTSTTIENGNMLNILII